MKTSEMSRFEEVVKNAKEAGWVYNDVAKEQKQYLNLCSIRLWLGVYHMIIVDTNYSYINMTWNYRIYDGKTKKRDDALVISRIYEKHLTEEHALIDAIEEALKLI